MPEISSHECAVTATPTQNPIPVQLFPVQLILGPMFSGKTTELGRRMRRYEIAKKTTIVIKWTGDTRNKGEKITTHDGHDHPAIQVTHLSHVSRDILDNVQVIGIDEGQFFSQLEHYVKLWRKLGKIVVIAALNGDFRQHCFGEVPLLLPISTVDVLTGVCVKCGGDGMYSHRLSKNKEQQFIGGPDRYECVCDTCYEILNNAEANHSPVQ